ncbi:MAG: phosphoribosylformylglycinamidine synthase, partial [Steroidobacterales bacterium]
MLQLAGAPALSAFRLDKLLRALRGLNPEITGVDAHFVHFIATRRELAPGERKLLDRLLTYGPRLPDEPVRGELILAIPRPGTISPWSSKATDIARVCGLDGIERMERGIAYRIATPRPLVARDLQRIAPPLFDRMTEIAIFDAGAAGRLFEHHKPRPLATVALGGSADAALERANRE